MSILPRIVDSLARQALESFELSSAVGHPGEGGSAREDAVRRLLKQVVPPNFGVDTGFVIDAHEGVSRQIDVIIYRKEHCPTLDVGGIRYFMVEAVAAVIECKASIQSGGQLNAALENIRSVKELDRTNDGKNRVLFGGRQLQADRFSDQVWGAVATGSSLAFDTCLDEIAGWLDERERIHWINAYVDIHEFMIEYILLREGVPWQRTTDPMTAEGIQGGMGITRDTGFSPPLAFFGIDFLDFLRISPVVDFSPSGYFYRTVVPKGRPLVFENPEKD